MNPYGEAKTGYLQTVSQQVVSAPRSTPHNFAISSVSTSEDMAADSAMELSQQILRDAIVFEHQLKDKIEELATVVETGKKGFGDVWKDQIDQDLLLTKIISLETQLETAFRQLSEPDLREELRQLQEENLRIKEKAKESVQKIITEKLEVQMKLLDSENQSSQLKKMWLQAQLDLQNESHKLLMCEFQLHATEDEKINNDDEVAKQETLLKAEISTLQEELLNADIECKALVKSCTEWQSRFQSMKLACEEAESRRLQEAQEFESELFTVNERCELLIHKVEKDKEKKKQEKLQRAAEQLDEARYRKSFIRRVCLAGLLGSLLLTAAVRVIYV